MSKDPRYKSLFSGSCPHLWCKLANCDGDYKASRIDSLRRHVANKKLHIHCDDACPACTFCKEYNLWVHTDLGDYWKWHECRHTGCGCWRDSDPQLLFLIRLVPSFPVTLRKYVDHQQTSRTKSKRRRPSRPRQSTLIAVIPQKSDNSEVSTKSLTTTGSQTLRCPPVN